MSFLTSNKKEECFGCEACVQLCPKNALEMKEDIEGFRYPVLNKDLCVNCYLCHNICPKNDKPMINTERQYVFGGFIKNRQIREESTSGGFFSAIVKTWCDINSGNYVIFGAEADRLRVFHSYITDINDLKKFRKSKYSQSVIGNTFKQTKDFLNNGKSVLYSGTPCQIDALKKYLNKTDTNKLLTIEVICEGVPSPLFVRSYDKYCQIKFKSLIKELDYRFKDKNKWDFEVMYTLLENLHYFKVDRWFNPFWSIWLSHLMSRPSCYVCPYTTRNRVADITLGDLWGVHLYCPELYGHNRGCSIAVCNTEKGKAIFKKTESLLYGHELDLDTAIKYQSSMRKPISKNRKRDLFLEDSLSQDYESLVKKWATKPDLKLLWSKYVYGNRQKVALWNLLNRLGIKKGK